MTDTNAKAKLYGKILQVQKSLEPLEKSGRNDFHKYSYTTAGDVLLPVQRACNAHGLIIVADCIDSKIEPGKAWVTVRLTVADSETGESMSITAPGYAEDWSYKDNRPSGDKAVYKATTGATKYAVRSFFCLPSEDDPERVTPTRVAATAATNGNPHKAVHTLQSDKSTSTNGKHAPAPRPRETQSENPPTTPSVNGLQKQVVPTTPAAITSAATSPTALEETTKEMQRVGWTVDQGRRFLQENFGVLSRKRLTSGQLRQFLDFLTELPAPERIPVPS